MARPPYPDGDDSMGLPSSDGTNDYPLTGDNSMGLPPSDGTNDFPDPPKSDDATWETS